MFFATVVLESSLCKVLLLIIALVNLDTCFLNVDFGLLKAFNFIVFDFNLNIVLVIVVGELHQVVHVVRILIECFHRTWVNYWLLSEVVPFLSCGRVLLSIILVEFLLIRHARNIQLTIIEHEVVVFVIDDVNIDHVDVCISLIIVQERVFMTLVINLNLWICITPCLA